MTITLPDPSRRYMSLQVISEDQYTSLVAYAPGRYAINEAQAGTRYAILLVRTLADPRRTDDMAAAHRLQDAIVVEQPHTGMFDVPDWDFASRQRCARNSFFYRGHIDPSKMFGAKGDVEPLAYLTGAAAGWGGLPRPAAVYESGAVARNDGKTVYRLTVHNVPVDGFWSISVYNWAGYFEKNELEAHSVNNVTATPNADGSVTVQFGGCNRGIANCLPIMPGWSYTVRLYRPRAEVLSGAWSFPETTAGRVTRQTALLCRSGSGFFGHGPAARPTVKLWMSPLGAFQLVPTDKPERRLSDRSEDLRGTVPHRLQSAGFGP